MEIDYVVAWVDGNDPQHREARLRFPPGGVESKHREAAGDLRFLESGEIYFNIASVLKFAPFIRRIFIVTDNQTPKHLNAFFHEGKCAQDRIRIVSHDEIFDGLDAARPTFNSLSIEAALWRIPGLSEHFVYANDDFFLNGPVFPDTFFADGRPVLTGKWQIPESHRLKNKVRTALRAITFRGRNTRPTFRRSLDLGAIVAGVTRGFIHQKHHPHPLRRSTFEQFFAENPDILRQQVSYRYRNIDQFNPVSLANHLEISRHGVPVGPDRDVAYITPGMGSRIHPEMLRMMTATPAFGCIQSLEEFEGDTAQDLRRVLTTKFRNTLPHAAIDALRLTNNYRLVTVNRVMGATTVETA